MVVKHALCGILIILLFLSSVLSFASAQEEKRTRALRYYLQDTGNSWTTWVVDSRNKEYWIYVFTPKGFSEIVGYGGNDRASIWRVIADDLYAMQLVETSSFQELVPEMKPRNERELKSAGYKYQGKVIWEPPKELLKEPGTTKGLQPVGAQEPSGDFLSDSVDNILDVFSVTGGDSGLLLYIFFCLMILLVFAMLGIDNMFFYILGIAGVTALFFVPAIMDRTGGGSFPVFIPIAIISLFIVVSALEANTGGGK